MKTDPVKTHRCGYHEFAMWLERSHPVVAEYRWPVCVEWEADSDGSIEEMRCYVIGSRGRFVPFTPTSKERNLFEQRICRRMEADDAQSFVDARVL